MYTSLQEHTGVNLCDFRSDNGFLDMVPKGKVIKEKNRKTELCKG